MAGVSWHRIVPRLFIVATSGIITIMSYTAVLLGFVASLLHANVTSFLGKTLLLSVAAYVLCQTLVFKHTAFLLTNFR